MATADADRAAKVRLRMRLIWDCDKATAGCGDLGALRSKERGFWSLMLRSGGGDRVEIPQSSAEEAGDWALPRLSPLQ